MKGERNNKPESESHIAELNAAVELLQAALDGSLDIIQVFKAVRDADNHITDFTWLMNNKRGIEQNGDVIGQSLLAKNPGVVEAGIFQRMVHVIETGIPNEQEQYYAHEQFNAWFRQTLVKSGDGVTMTTRDITEQKKAEQEIIRLKEGAAQRAEAGLRESEKRFQSIANLVPDLLWESEADGSTNWYNQRWLEYTGQSLEQAIGWGWIDAIHPEDQEGSAKRYAEAGKTGMPLRQEHRIRRYDGEYRWFVVSALPLKDKDGHVVKMYGAATDIHDRKQAEEALRISQAKFRRLSESGIVAIAFFDIGGQIVDANDAFLEMLGVTKDDLQTEKVRWDVYTAKEWMPRTMQAIEEFKQTGYISPYEKQFYHTSGEPRWGIFAGATLGDGKTGVSLVIDITKRKKAEEALGASEEKYRSIFESIDEGFTIQELILDENDNVVDILYLDANKAFEQHTGIKDVVGKKASEIVPHLEQEWLDAMTHVYKTGETSRTEGYQSDMNRWITLQYTRVGDLGSRLLSVVFQDITERKRREERQKYLLKLSDALRPLSDPLEVKSMASQVLGEHLKADRVFYAEMESDGVTTVIHDNYAREGVPKFTGSVRTTDFGKAAERLKNGETVVLTNVTTDEFTEEEKLAYAGNDMVAAIAVPLHKANYYVANLVVHSRVPRRWTADEVAMVQETSERTWEAVERAKAEKVIRTTEERMRALKETFQGVVNGANVEDSLRLLTQLVMTETHQQARTSFYIVNENGTTLHPIYGAGNMPHAYLDEINSFPIGENSFACGLAIPTGQPVITPDVTEDPRWKDWVYVTVKYDYRACWSFPIKTREDNAIGTFSMYFKETRQAKPKDFALAEVITQAAAVIISSHTENQQRIRAEEALLQSEQQLRKRERELMRVQEVGLMAGIDISFGQNVNESYSWRSPEYRRLHGLLPGTEYETHEDWLKRLHPDDGKKADETLANALSSNAQIYQNEYRIIRPVDGEVRWIFARVDIERDEEGRPLRLVGAHIDVTERKKVEQKLQEFTFSLEQQVTQRTIALQLSRDLFQSVFDTSLVQMSVFKALRDERGDVVDFEILIVNKELERATSRFDLIGKRYLQEYPGVKEAGVWEVMLEVLETGKPKHLEYFYPYEGFKKWFSTMFVKLDDGLVVTNLDITERKNAELASSDSQHFMEGLTVASPDILFVMNIHTKEVIYSNRSPAQALGYTKEQCGKMENEILDIIHPEDFPRFIAHIDEMATANDGEVRVIEYHVMDAQGKVRWMHDRNAVFRRDALGKVIEKIGVTHEVTEQKKAQEELIRLRLLQQRDVLDAVLRSQEKERERIGEALHNGIGQLLYAAQIKCDLLSEGDSHYPSLIKELTEILNEAITETRNISFELVPTVLRDFGLEIAIKTLLQRITHHGLRLQFASLQIENRLAEILEISIYRIVQELLNNIVKHSKATMASVRIEKGAEAVQLVVSDNGIGFDLKKIAEANKGIGLQSIRNRAKLLNSELSIKTSPGKGTKVRVEIPLG